MMPRPELIFLMGPTASGKTALSIELAQKLNGEVISIDSALVYRDMNIGSAKPTKEEQQGIPHHLIDIVNPDEEFSVAVFRQLALKAIKDCLLRGKMPILAGGTMMYYKILLEGLALGLPDASPELRATLQTQLEQEGLPALVADLIRHDPGAESEIHLENPQRVLRALEVFYTCGTPITQLWKQQKEQKQQQALPYHVIQLCLSPEPRSVLHQRIKKRFEQMLEQGLEQEVTELRDKYQLHEDLPAIRSVGYRQMWQYLEGLFGYEDMVERGIIATRQLAKRQLTWLRGWQDLHRFDSLDPSLSKKVLKKLSEHSIL